MKKRILVLILALTIPFSVMGCGRKEEKVSISGGYRQWKRGERADRRSR